MCQIQGRQAFQLFCTAQQSLPRVLSYEAGVEVALELEHFSVLRQSGSYAASPVGKLLNIFLNLINHFICKFLT